MIEQCCIIGYNDTLEIISFIIYSVMHVSCTYVLRIVHHLKAVVKNKLHVRSMITDCELELIVANHRMRCEEILLQNHSDVLENKVMNGSHPETVLIITVTAASSRIH